MIKKHLLIASVAAHLFAFSPIQAGEGLSNDEIVNFQTAFAILEFSGNHIWPNWHGVPRQTRYLSNGYEYIICAEGQHQGFKDLGINESLGCRVIVRKSDQKAEKLKTITFDHEIPTVQIAAPSRRNKLWMPWVIAWLHEHTHQWQMSLPHYDVNLAALGLTPIDNPSDVSWMTNYPFPYDDPQINDLFEQQKTALFKLFDSLKKGAAPLQVRKNVKKYLKTKTAFQKQAGDYNYRYASFQAWQEGVARYTEYKTLEKAIYMALKQPGTFPVKTIKSLAKYAEYKIKAIKEDVANSSLSKNQREAFYAIGAMEALILDKLSPNWRQTYDAHHMTLDWAFVEWQKQNHLERGDKWEKDDPQNPSDPTFDMKFKLKIIQHQ